MTDAQHSRTVRAGSRTYFLDLKKTSEGKSYLVVTQSRFKDEGKERERHSIMVFPEDAKAFLAAVTEMVGQL